jgi:hypothetical protein
VLASIRSGTATASLPAAMAHAARGKTLHALGKRWINIDRNRHRDRKTKNPRGIPRRRPRHHHAGRHRPRRSLHAGRSLTLTATASIP